MRIIFGILIVFSCYSAYGITPQQYCEALESKKTNSFEILNFEHRKEAYTDPLSLLKYCKAGRFCIIVTTGANLNFSLKCAKDGDCVGPSHTVTCN